MANVIQHLRSFDRKERFAVLREALGFHPEAPRLDDGFRGKLVACIGKQVPAHAFLAMDYHLDWLQLALHLVEHPQIRPCSPFPKPCDLDEINENQEDIDLLVAFEDVDAGRWVTHLILVEAKAYLPWSNPQLKSKVKRLIEMFGENGKARDSVKPHFVLMTGQVSCNIDTDCWPNWMKNGEAPFWLKYDLPRRLEVTRWSEERKRSVTGDSLLLKWTTPHKT